MADLKALLLSFPPEKPLPPAEHDKAATAYVKRLSSLSPQEWKEALSKSDVFDTLDPTTHTISYLFALHKAISQSDGSASIVSTSLPRCTQFFKQFDGEQARYAPEQWRELYEWTISALASTKQKDIEFMGAALQRISLSSVFTSNHLGFLRLCLSSAQPSLALPVLDADIYSITPKLSVLAQGEGKTDEKLTGSLHVELLLEYYLLGASVYIGQSQWSRAKLFLEFVMLHPSTNHATSSLQVEAYKKWVLIGLLTKGEAPASVRTMDQVVLRNIRSLSKPYDVLADTFKHRNWRKVHAEVDVGSQVWLDDGNARLVQAVSSAILPFCVSDLQKTYASVPLSVVARHLGVTEPDATTIVNQMIQQKQLNATLLQANTSTALRFEQAAKSISDSYAQDTAAQTKRIESLVAAIADADRRLQLTKEHLEMSRRNRKQALESDPADQMDLDYGPTAIMDPLMDDGDEDIMA